MRRVVGCLNKGNLNFSQSVVKACGCNILGLKKIVFKTNYVFLRFAAFNLIFTTF